MMKSILRSIASFLICFLMFSSFVSCSLQENGTPLYILMDLHADPTMIGTDGELEKQLTELLEFTYGLLPQDVTIEFLPTEESERSARIAALRTELMSGKGPDVFILQSSLPMGQEREEYLKHLTAKHSLKISATAREPLFQNPQKSMEDGLFLPLDSYLENAQFFDPNVIEPAILAAGQTEDGQMILPLTFTMPTAVYEASVTDRTRAERCACGATAWNQFPDLFGKIADYQEGNLLFTKGDLLQTVTEALTACPVKSLDREEKFPGQDLRLLFSPQETNGLVSLGSLHHDYLSSWRPNYFSGEWEEGAAPETISAVPNMEGGVTAQITTYACINRNTKRADEAFQVVDLLVRREVMGDIAIRKSPEDKTEIDGFLLACFYDTMGVPVRNDLLGDGKSHFGYNFSFLGRSTTPEYEASPKTYEIYKNLRAQVTTARFYGELDWELQEMFNACREAESDEEIEKIVSKAYDTMLMILAES